jgi:hypothetical protein
MSYQSKPVTIDEILDGVFKNGYRSGSSEQILYNHKPTINQAVLAINKIVMDIIDTKIGDKYCLTRTQQRDLLATAHQYGLGENK